MLMVTIWSVFACLNYVINPSANLLMLSSNLAWLAHQNGKKTHVVPIHEKNHKQYVKNYRPVSLLPICSNILERIIYNTLLKHFIDNNLISENQSGSKPGDSCLNQLWAITHEIFFSFDDNYEVRGVSLNISKAFDKVRHEEIIHKHKRSGISANLLSLLTDFLTNRKLRVILKFTLGQDRCWCPSRFYIRSAFVPSIREWYI